MSSPTQRTLAKLRKDGWFCAITERFNPHVKIRQDLFGFVDVLAFRGDYVLAIQCTSGDHVADRIKKILALPAARLWLSSPHRFLQVWGWRKTGPRGKRKTWSCREVAVTDADFDDSQPLVDLTAQPDDPVAEMADWHDV